MGEQFISSVVALHELVDYFTIETRYKTKFSKPETLRRPTEKKIREYMAYLLNRI